MILFRERPGVTGKKFMVVLDFKLADPKHTSSFRFTDWCIYLIRIHILLFCNIKLARFRKIVFMKRWDYSKLTFPFEIPIKPVTSWTPMYASSLPSFANLIFKNRPKSDTIGCHRVEKCNVPTSHRKFYAYISSE